jgi:glycerol-3-phosphate dehydrogenase subunit B
MREGKCWSGLGKTRPRVFGGAGKAYPLRVVGFEGWRDFYPRTIADGMRAEGWSSVETSTIPMPDFGGNFDNWSTELADWLDTPEGFDQFVREVRASVPANPAETLYFPAVLGFKPDTLARLREALGSVIEIPTLPPSIPGLRLYHALRRAIIDRGGRFTVGARVVGLETSAGRVTGTLAETTAHGRTRFIPADAVILATGGLFGGGLESDYQGRVREVVADLHVANLPPLADWFAHPLLSAEVQPIHRAGIVTDADLRPLDASGSVTAPNLYAAGRLLAGYSPVVEGSTEGVDIATGAHAAFRALTAFGAP